MVTAFILCSYQQTNSGFDCLRFAGYKITPYRYQYSNARKCKKNLVKNPLNSLRMKAIRRKRDGC